MFSLIRPTLQVAAPVLGRAAIAAASYGKFFCGFAAVSTSGYLIGRFVTERVERGVSATTTWLDEEAGKGNRRRRDRFLQNVEAEIARRVRAGELSVNPAPADFVDVVAHPAPADLADAVAQPA
jgi:hypothetical protein